MSGEDTPVPEPTPTADAPPRPRPAAPDAPDTPGKDPIGTDWAPRHVAVEARPALARRVLVASGRGISAVAMRGLDSGWRFAAWRRTPVGGFVAPLLGLLLVVALAGAAGATLPSVRPGHPRPAAAPKPVPAPSASASTPAPGPAVPTPTGTVPGRAVDGLTDWASRLSPAVGIPVPALKAYGYAQLRTALATPGCHLSWTTLAGIGLVESGHGSAGGARLGTDGRVAPRILGPALDGQGGRQLVRDTDLGHYDGDTTFDRAVGPMQLLPAAWETYQADGDGDGVRDPFDLNDAALAAAGYLCAGGRDLGRPAGWWPAVLSYNPVDSYVQAVFAAADRYGKLSRAVQPTSGT